MPYDAIVVGGGPAGAALAIWLGARGRSVLVLDRARFPRDKVCGECLVPGAIADLHDLGVAAALIAAGAVPIRGLRLVATDGQHVEVPYPDGVCGYTISRIELDQVLLDRARQTPGVTVRDGCAVTGLVREGAAIAGVQLANGEEHRARVVVGADGRFSLVRRLAFGADDLPPTDRFCFLNTFAGVAEADDMLECGLIAAGMQYLRVDQGQGRCSVCVVVDRRTRDAHAPGTPAGFTALALAQPRLAKRLAGATLAGPMKGMPMTPYAPAALVADGVLLAGDAVGFMDPITGEGMCRALKSARLAAEVLDRALDAAPGVLARNNLVGYERGLRELEAPMLRFVGLAVRFTTLPGWASPLAVQALSACPSLAGAVAAAQGAMLPPADLLLPHRWPVARPGALAAGYKPLVTTGPP